MAQYAFGPGTFWTGPPVVGAPIPPAVVTWNPADAGLGISLSNGNLTATQTGLTGSVSSVRATAGIDSSLGGQYGFEVSVQALDVFYTYDAVIGIGTASATTATQFTHSPTGYGKWRTGQAENNATPTAYGFTTLVNDTVGVLVNYNDMTITLYRNNVSAGVMFTIAAGTYYPMVACAYNTSYGADILTGNFGASTFVTRFPSGTLSWDNTYSFP
jgi:hypothetical protein